MTRVLIRRQVTQRPSAQQAKAQVSDQTILLETASAQLAGGDPGIASPQFGDSMLDAAVYPGTVSLSIGKWGIAPREPSWRADFK